MGAVASTLSSTEAEGPLDINMITGRQGPCSSGGFPTISCPNRFPGLPGGPQAQAALTEGRSLLWSVKQAMPKSKYILPGAEH